MKFSLDTVGYGGYFTDGAHLSLEDGFRRASEFGYDAACIFAHRPLAFPMDLDAERRKSLKDLAGELDLELGAVVCCTSFLKGDHVLVFPQEKEIMYVKESIDLAVDLDMKIVRVLAAFYGYFQNPYASQGYGNPAFESRSRRVSQSKDWLEAWHQVKDGLREVALYAEDQGITLALQTHPEITNNNEETLELIEEVGVPSLKVGLDLPLFESQDPDFVRKTVKSMEGLMVYSHSISIATKHTVGGAPFGWDEVEPGSEKDPCQWRVFMETCKEIGYDGYLSHEQCSPIIVKGHRIAGLDEVDRRYEAALAYLKGIALELDYYTGHKGLVASAV
jgi:sugar phosphate isomerase/epimerase